MTAPANSQVAPEGVHQPVGPHPGDEPLGNPASRWISVCTSLLLIALTGIGIRDLWYHFYTEESLDQSWLGRTWEFLATFPADVAAIVISIIMILVGLALLFYTFKPRPRTHVRVASPVSIWTRPVDIARKATGTARTDLGAEHVSSKANRKSITVQATDDGSGAALQERLTRNLNNEFKALAAPPAVSVKLRPGAAKPAPVQQTTTITETTTETTGVQR